MQRKLPLRNSSLNTVSSDTEHSETDKLFRLALKFQQKMLVCDFRNANAKV